MTKAICLDSIKIYFNYPKPNASVGMEIDGWPGSGFLGPQFWGGNFRVG